MRWTTRAVVLVFAFSVAAVPVAADVIPTRIEGEESAKASDTVVHRLTEMGVPQAEARAQVEALDDATVAYFASSPDSLQFVGQAGQPIQGQEIFAGETHTFWYELLLGFVMISTVALVIGWYIYNN
ncbi:MAG: hypothetical protein ACYTAF_05475 [Planctomycetota bacterium]|jgi:hypothetical protein